MKKLMLFLVVVSAVPSLNAGGGKVAGGIFGGLAGLAILSSLADRDRDVVYADPYYDPYYGEEIIFVDDYGYRHRSPRHYYRHGKSRRRGHHDKHDHGKGIHKKKHKKH